MRQIDKLKNKLEYVRFTHLAIIVTTATLVYLTVTLPHKWWILLTALVVSSGIQPGLIVKRSLFRVKGTFLALIFLVPLLYLLQLNYRFISVIFILSLIGLAVSTLNIRRYDISVFFITLFVFFLTAFSTVELTPEGPFEMVLNRGIGTLIGVIIVLMSDYFLFNSFHYSKKLYLFHQLLVINFFRRELRILTLKPGVQINRFMYIKELREECNKLFTAINISAENLEAELRSDRELAKRVHHFQKDIWELRRLLFALTYSALILKDEKTTAEQEQSMKALLKDAKSYL